ncbi:MAG: hypothetical protein LBU27_08860 [Candidatus Peribacteria bacterium]|jgi:hypothetical protein|nr:hypothetical protein [Candidatus Peribacteria bacterium]
MLKKLRIKKFDTYFNGDRDSLFAYLIAICYLLKHIHNGAEWISKFKDFIHQHTEIELPKM